ncbi:MAG: YlbF family regulator [Planctomycetes bacterium]|nr:YlbF family regulator [Planctomycetota bacterium]
MPDDIDELITLADQLARRVRETDLYKAFTSAKTAFDADPKANDLVQAYQKEATDLHRREQEMLPVEPAQKRRVKEMEDAISMHQVCLRYLAAQTHFSRLLMALHDHIDAALFPNDGEAETGGAPSGPVAAGAAGAKKKPEPPREPSRIIIP